MASARLVLRGSRVASQAFSRPFSTTLTKPIHTNERGNDTAPLYRKYQIEKPLAPHLTNTTSTIANDMPSLGADSPPPELITNVDPDFVPTDAKPENTERMTGGTQKPAPDAGPNADLKVGEIEGGTFRVEPLRRTGEDANTLRARLLCTSLIASRSRPGTIEG